MKKMVQVLSVLIFLSLVIGCATVPAGPGDKPDATPPKISIQGDDARTKAWDRPGAFGPVPAELQANGDKVCGETMKAIGYHPQAQDENGKTFQGGGYLCVPR